MAKINESLLSNLVAAFTGAAIGKAVADRKPKPATKKQIDKYLNKHPEVKKAAKELQDSQKKVAKAIEKELEKLSPAERDRMNRLYGV